MKKTKLIRVSEHTYKELQKIRILYEQGREIRLSLDQAIQEILYVWENDKDDQPF